MKFKRIAVASLLSAFFISNSFADSEFNIDDGTYGIKFVSRDKKTFNYLNDKPSGEVLYLRNLKTGEISSSVHKIGCFYTHCLVYKKKVAESNKPKENMKIVDISGSELRDPDQKDADELGMTLADYKKMIKEDNDYGRIWQEIQLKKAEQLRKEQLEKEKNKNSGKTGGNGNKKIEKIYVNSDTGAISDTFEGACTGKHRYGWPVRLLKGSDGERDFCQVYDPSTYGGRALGTAPIYEERVTRQDGDCGMGSNKTFGKNNDGTFSVVCTHKHKPNEESPSVASTSNSSSNTSSPDSSRHNSSSVGGGASAGGGNAPGGGSSGASTAGGSTSPGNSETGGGLSGVNSNNGSSSNSVSSGNSNNSSGSGTSSGSGEGNADNEGDFKGIPKYGEPDWGNLKSDGGFGNFSPSNAFSTGGSCMADVQLDMGEFGNHTLPMSFLCQVLEKLRYVFISMAYLYSAILVFKTVNSLKG